MITKSFVGKVHSVSVKEGGQVSLMLFFKRDPNRIGSEFIHVDLDRSELGDIEPGTPFAVKVCIGLGEP